MFWLTKRAANEPKQNRFTTKKENVLFFVLFSSKFDFQMDFHKIKTSHVKIKYSAIILTGKKEILQVAATLLKIGITLILRNSNRDILIF